MVGGAILGAATVMLGALTWTLEGCSACGGDSCFPQAFWLGSTGECFTKVETPCQIIKVACNNVGIYPPRDAGACDVVATLEGGTTLSLSVAFTVTGHDCCGNRYEISPPSHIVGSPDAGMIDASADAADQDASTDAGADADLADADASD